MAGAIREDVDIAIRAVAFTIATALATGASASSPTLAEEREIFAKTCNQYENRSRFDARGEGQSFVAVLADTCISAMDALTSNGADAREARDYLLRLTELKDAIVEMQVNAFRASRERAQPGARYARIITSVSEAGEYLIAQQIGVIDTLDAWTATEIARKGQSETVLR